MVPCLPPPATAAMRCLFSLALGLLALEAALAQDSAVVSSEAICPALRPSEEMPCAQEQKCSSDQDCLGGRVCCPSACGRSCRTPINSVQKAGRCPWVQPVPVSKLCVERDQCTKDSDCLGLEKCCTNGCAKQCLPPVPEIPLQ